MSQPPHPYGCQIAIMRCHGREADAAKLLDALNCIQRAFGFPDYDMPEPYPTSERADLEPKELPNGRYQVAA
ncbi:MAG: hypothetical protein JWR80_9525 [Bradyrhizobium sp.]|nr:hypothetical protein [Bradyrhizobium sp.]